MKSSVLHHKEEEYARQLQAIFRENSRDPVALHAAVQDLFGRLTADWSRTVADLRQENAVLQRAVETGQRPPHRDAHAEALEQIQTYAEELATTNEELEAANEMLNSQNEELAAARKTAEMERERYYELFDAAPEGYLVTDRSGKILEANRTAGVLLAIHKDSLMGRNLLNFAREGRAELRTRMARAIGGEGRQAFEVDLLPVMAKPIHASVSIVSVGTGVEAEPSLRWMIRDISERKQAEEALRRLNREVEAARDEANLYVDILTHDIRNTENVSNLYAELLADSLEGDKARYMASLQRSIRKSIEILGTVSTIRQIHRMTSELKPMDLDSAIQDTVRGYPHTTVRYEGTHHRVHADDLLSVIFNNLIGNAVKHGGSGVEVAVRVEEVGGSIRVSVEDTGRGVPDEEKTTIFHRYEQQKRGVGEGLGLYLVQILIRRYGGRIWVEDRVPGCPGEGAAFRLTLRKAA